MVSPRAFFPLGEQIETCIDDAVNADNVASTDFDTGMDDLQRGDIKGGMAELKGLYSEAYRVMKICKKSEQAAKDLQTLGKNMAELLHPKLLVDRIEQKVDCCWKQLTELAGLAGGAYFHSDYMNVGIDPAKMIRILAL